MQKYDLARNELHKQLYDKLMCDRFGWEINIWEDKYILEIPITREEFEEKKALVNKVVRELIHEYDVYRYRCDDHDNDPRTIPTPTIYNLQIMSIEFDDTPIDMSQAYEVKPEDINRTVDKKHFVPYEANAFAKQVKVWNEQKDEDFPHMGDEVVKALAELGVTDVAKQD